MPRSGSLLAARFLFCFVVKGNLLEVVGLEDLVAVQAPDVIDPISPHHEFRALMLTARHIKQIILILVRAVALSSPRIA
jgi:hypothetical protein